MIARTAAETLLLPPFVTVVLFLLTVPLGLAVGYLAFRGLRRGQRRAAQALALGLVVLTAGDALLGATVGVGETTLLAGGKVDAPGEWLNAAIVLQHGTCPEHFELANRLAVAANESAEVDATRWVYLTYDRWQVSIGEPQRYRTQTGSRPVNAACHPPVPAGLNVSAPLGGVSDAV